MPSDGNCTGTLAHIDPYERGEVSIVQSYPQDTSNIGRRPLLATLLFPKRAK